MTTYVALLRGINGGGRHQLKMSTLRGLLAEIGLQTVRTYIQSGNVVFQSDDIDPAELAATISAAIDEQHGFEPRVLVLTRDEVAAALAAIPFPEAEDDPRSLHLYFLAEDPEQPDLDALEALRKESERVEIKQRVFYLHAPDGIGRSKLAASAEKQLGVPMTARNWRTVRTIMEMADS